MSRNNNNNNIKNVKKTPYCKVCHDAGKPESDYTNHWVKSLPDKSGNSTIICPTLLDTQCRYCFKLGHTTKFCPVLEQQNKKKEKENRRAQSAVNEQKTLQVKIPSKSSTFAILDLGSDSEEEEKEVKVREEYPSLVESRIHSVELTGWAAIAAKPKVEKPTVFGCLLNISKPQLVRQPVTNLTDTPVVQVQSVPQAKNEVVANSAPWAKKNVVVKKSWADYSESESEEEQEQEWYGRYKEVQEETW